MCGWSEYNQWYLSDLSFWIIYSKCSLPDTVIYHGCFKHYSEHVEGPQLDQEEITTDCLSALTYRLPAGAQRLGGTATIHTFILLSIKTLTAMNEPSLTRWGRKGVLFPEGLFLFPRDAVLLIEKSKGRSFGYILETGPRPVVRWKMSNCSQSGTRHLWKLDPHSRDLLSPSVLVVRITMWTAHLVIWSSRSDRQIQSVLLMRKQKPPKLSESQILERKKRK